MVSLRSSQKDACSSQRPAASKAARRGGKAGRDGFDTGVGGPVKLSHVQFRSDTPPHYMHYYRLGAQHNYEIIMCIFNDS